MSEDFCGRYHPIYHTHIPDSTYVDDHPRDPGGGGEGIIRRRLAVRLRGGGEVVGGDEVLGGSAATVTLGKKIGGGDDGIFAKSPPCRPVSSRICVRPRCLLHFAIQKWPAGGPIPRANRCTQDSGANMFGGYVRRKKIRELIGVNES